MAFELRKSYIFLFFIVLHVIFWDYSNGEVTTLIHGDWADQWQYIISKTKDYNAFPRWAKFFYVVEERTGLAIYFSVIFFSFLNTCLFVLFAKTLEVFDKKYSVIVTFLILLSPSSAILLLMMYKDNFSFLSFAIMLFIIARIFANKPLSLSKNIFLYICAAFLIVISRYSYVPFLTFIISISFLLSFLLSFKKSYPIKNMLTLLLIFIINYFYFYTGFDRYLYDFSRADVIQKSEDVVLTHSHINILSEDDKLEVIRLLAIQDELNKELKYQLTLEEKADSNWDKNRLISQIERYILVQKNNLSIKYIRFFAELKHRKISNLFAAPNASLNYDSPSTIRNSNLQLVLSHVPKTIFAPYIFQIMDTNVGNEVKVIFFLETLFNYILALSVLLFLVSKKLYKLFFVTVLFSCMYITNLFDSNFGTYLRHAYIFNKLFLGVGFLGALYFLKPNIRINIKKGLL